METNKSHFRCSIVVCRDIGADIIELVTTWSSPAARPGQFAMLRGEWGDAPLLPRAVSFCDCTADRAHFLFRRQGPGTHRLAKLQPGETIFITGPLGNAFPVMDGAWLAAGGIGLPPLWFYRRRHGGRLFWGVLAKSAAIVHEDGWEMASDDGKLGFHGTVVQLVERELSVAASPPPAVLACGPYPMLSALKEACNRHGIPLFVSLEGKMACGIGVCCGCAHPAEGGGYRHVCEDGPDFNAREVQL